MAKEFTHSPTSTTVDLAGLPEHVVTSIKQLVESLRQSMASELPDMGTPRHPPLRGRYADLGLSIPKEEIDAARREAWQNFPREFPESGSS